VEEILLKWLKKKVAVQATFYSLASMASFGLGIVVLAITFFVSYAIVWFGFNYGVSAVSDLVFGKSLHLSSSRITIVCSLFLILLFIENIRTSREYLDSYSLKQPVSPSLTVMAGVTGALITLLANSDASGKIIADLLFSGPRLIIYSVSALHRALRFLQINVQGCSKALMVLFGKTSRISLNELAVSLQGFNPVNILFQLQEIEGILFIAKDPTGITLTEDLRSERAELFRSAAFEVAEEPTAVPENPDYYKLLGLSPSASLEEIKIAYRRCIKQCHPDKFVGRAKQFRELAEERAKAINAAYEALLAKHNATN